MLNEEKNISTSEKIDNVDLHCNGDLGNVKVYVKENKFGEENKKNKSEQEDAVEVKNDTEAEPYLKKNVEDKDVKDNPVRKSSRFKDQ